MTTQPEPVDNGFPTAEPGRAVPEARDGQAADSEHGLKLTVAAVARRLGVAPATLRTWDRRYGLGPSGHTSGSHRRYDADDVARLEQMQRALLRGATPAEAARYARTVSLGERPVATEQALAEPVEAEPETVLSSGVLGNGEGAIATYGPHTGGRGLRLGGAGPAARGLGRAVLALDSYSAQRLMIESVEVDGVVDTWDDVVSPVLAAVTERRQRSGTGAELVQLLLDSVATAFRSVIATAPAPTTHRPVLLASVPGEGQELELVALAAGLARAGVAHRLFGPALPKEALDAAVRRSVPAGVVLWSAQESYAAPALFEGVASARRRVRAFAAGPGWAGQVLPAQVEPVATLAAALGGLAEAAGRPA